MKHLSFARRQLQPLGLALCLSLLTLASCSKQEQPPAPTGVGSFSPLDPNNPNGGITPFPTDGTLPADGTLPQDPTFNPEDTFDPNAVDPSFDPNAVDPNADPNAVDPNALPEDPNALPEDPNALPEDPNAVDPNADPNALPEDPLATLPDTTTGDGGIGDLLPDLTPSAAPDTTGEFGNKSLGFLGTPVMEYVSGIAVSGSQVYLTHYKKGSLIGFNNRQVRAFNLSDGKNTDLTVFGYFSDSEPPTPLLSGVTVTQGEVWSTLKTPDSDGYNVYRLDSAGKRINRYKVNSPETEIKDAASSTSFVYLACPTTQSVIQFNIQTPANTKIQFTGATALNPAGVATDTSGNLYVSDSSSKKVLKFDANGNKQLEFEGTGTDGSGKAFSSLGDLAVDPRNGDIYVLSGFGASAISRYNSAGKFIHSFGHSDLNSPEKMAVGSNGHVYVVDASQKTAFAFDAGK